MSCQFLTVQTQCAHTQAHVVLNTSMIRGVRMGCAHTHRGAQTCDDLVLCVDNEKTSIVNEMQGPTHF